MSAAGDDGRTAPEARLLELLLAAMDLEPEQRGPWLRGQTHDSGLVAEVERLLQEDARLETSAAPFDHPLEPGPVADLVGSDLGAYRLTEVLGIGGMGTVYLGERRDDFEQRVAVKVVRRDVHLPWNLARLERERQILAGLDHPNIARLLDGGRTPGGAPFLVMELVDGEPVTRYARRCGLDAAGILRLFLEVCAAVEAAHQALLVHGDLKPGNILVTADGAVKLLDFGVARMLGEEPAAPPPRALTPAYASPEQLRRGMLTVASDVYSLGVVLYQLLTGRLPHPTVAGADLAGAADAVAGSAPRPPSEVDRVAGLPLPRGRGAELDAVVLKALAPAAADRYASVAELAEDCRRLLANEPVRALPRRLGYTARKFVARHRAAVAAATCAVLALVLTAVAALQQARLAASRAADSEQQRTAAEQQRRRAAAVTDFLVGMFNAANVESEDAVASDVRVTDLLDRAEARLDADRELPLETRLDLRLTLLELEQSLHRFDRARSLGRSALAELRRAPDSSALREAWIWRGLGLVESDAGDFAAAEAAYRRVLRLADGSVDRGTTDAAGVASTTAAGGWDTLDHTARLELAGVLMYQDRCDEASDLVGPILARRDGLTSRAGLVELANAVNQLSGCASKAGDDDRAWSLLLEARDLMERGAGPRSSATATILSNLGQEARLQGRCEAAIEPLERSLAIRAELGVDERDNLRARGSLAYCLAELGREQAARSQLERTIEAAESLPDGHYRKAGGYIVIGRTLELLGEPERAAPYLERCLEWQRELAPASPYVATLEYYLAENLVERGRTAEGARELERLLAVFEQREGATARHTVRAARALARAWTSLGEDQRAAALRDRYPGIAAAP